MSDLEVPWSQCGTDTETVLYGPHGDAGQYFFMGWKLPLSVVNCSCENHTLKNYMTCSALKNFVSVSCVIPITNTKECTVGLRRDRVHMHYHSWEDLLQCVICGQQTENLGGHPPCKHQQFLHG